MKHSKLQFTNWKTIFLLTVFSLSILGCSKDDHEVSGEPINFNGGTVFQYQIVQIDLPNVAFGQNEYEATLGDMPLTVVSTNEHQIAFAVPMDFPLGNTTLIIPSLNANITYNIVQATLSQPAEEIIAEFLDDLEVCYTELEQISGSSGVAHHNYNQFLAYYAQSSADEKEEIALFYQINKPIFDMVLNPVSYRPQGVNYDQSVIDLHALGIVTGLTSLGIGLGLLQIKSPYAAAAAIVTIGTGIGIWYHSWDGLKEIVFKAATVSLGQITGDNNKMSNNEIEIQSELSSTFSLQLGVRRLQDSDRTDATTRVSEFFSSQDKFNSKVIDNINDVIIWVKTKIPFLSSSLQTFDHAALTSNAALIDEVVDEEFMEHLSFTINHPNLQLLSTSLQNDGQLKLTAKIIGNPSTTPVLSTLNYTYSDDFSTFSGHFDLKVSMFSLAGEWQVIEYNDSTGKSLNNWGNFYYGQTYCPDVWTLAYMVTSTTPAVFTATTFSIPITTTTQTRVVPNSECQIESTNIYSSDSAFSGYYYAPQDDIIPAGGASFQQYFEIVDENTITYHEIDTTLSFTIVLSRL